MPDKLHKKPRAIEKFKPDAIANLENFASLQVDSDPEVMRLIGATDHTDLEDFSVHQDTE